MKRQWEMPQMVAGKAGKKLVGLLSCYTCLGQGEPVSSRIRATQDVKLDPNGA